MSVFDNMKAASGTATASGAFPIIKNSANGKMKNLKLFGASTKTEGKIESVVLNKIKASKKNILPYPYYGASQKVTEGVTFETDENGVVTINGTSTGDAYLDLYLSQNEILTDIPIIFSKGSENNVDLFYCERIDGKWGSSTSLPETELKITPSKNATGQIFRIALPAGRTASNLKIYPMIRPASIENADFEPYKGNIANLPEAFEMNGIGESKDCIDFERGVITTKAFKKVFDGSEDWAHHDPAYPHLFKVTVQPPANVLNNACMCSHFPFDEGDLMGGLDGCRFRRDSKAVVFYISSSKHSTAANFKTWIAEQHANGTPVSIVYRLSEPIETPLSPAALLELNKLRTFDSITCVSNDAGAEMEIDYFKNNATGQAMSDIHAGVPRFVLDGTTLHIIV